MSIPILLLWNVQISIRRKLALGAILCLSIFTMIISIIKVAGGEGNDGAVDTAWVLFWYDIEAAVAIIIVSVTAFRALFVAHQAMKYRSPPEKDSSRSWSFWSRKSKSSRKKELPNVPSPVLGGVKTHIRGSHYGGPSLDNGAYNLELPLHGPGITVTQVVQTEKVRQALHPEKSKKTNIVSRHLAIPRDLLRNPLFELQSSSAVIQELNST